MVAFPSVLIGMTARGQATPGPRPLEEIVVTARRLDLEVQAQVTAALREDRYANDRHVTVNVRNGIVTLEGFVTDEWDLRALRRAASKVAGVKKVVNNLDLVLGGE